MFKSLFKKSTPVSAWYVTTNPKFVGYEQNIACSLNKNHILFSSKGNFYVATHKLIENKLWKEIAQVFDNKTPAMETDLIAINNELNATCENILNELSREAETAGLHSIID